MGRKKPILVNRLLAKIHSTDRSIYRQTNRQMDGYKDGEEDQDNTFTIKVF